VTQKEREDRFIERCRKDLGSKLTWESELLLRYGFAAGASELGVVAYAAGVETQRASVLAVLGAAPRKEERLP
jgi:hypothetical protein